MSQNTKTKIFLDSGDPKETREILNVLGYLDGQTTNPSLIAKNPETFGKKFTHGEILDFYKKVVQEISTIIPAGSVSIEVYADAHTSAENMLKEAREFFTWIPNAHIKFPTTVEGLKAAEVSIKEGRRVNMTLCFSEEQAAAVYSATKGAKKGDVFVSPFVGRFDDRGERGMDLIANILKMYEHGDGHVEVLSASIRSQTHMQESLALGSDIITAPLKILKEWKEGVVPEVAETPALKPIAYKGVPLDRPWQDYDLHHEMTDAGILKFSADWNKMIQK